MHAETLIEIEGSLAFHDRYGNRANDKRPYGLLFDDEAIEDVLVEELEERSVLRERRRVRITVEAIW